MPPPLAGRRPALLGPAEWFPLVASVTRDKFELSLKQSRGVHMMVRGYLKVAVEEIGRRYEKEVERQRSLPHGGLPPEGDAGGHELLLRVDPSFFSDLAVELAPPLTLRYMQEKARLGPCKFDFKSWAMCAQCFKVYPTADDRGPGPTKECCDKPLYRDHDSAHSAEDDPISDVDSDGGDVKLQPQRVNVAGADSDSKRSRPLEEVAAAAAPADHDDASVVNADREAGESKSPVPAARRSRPARSALARRRELFQGSGASRARRGAGDDIYEGLDDDAHNDADTQDIQEPGAEAAHHASRTVPRMHAQPAKHGSRARSLLRRRGLSGLRTPSWEIPIVDLKERLQRMFDLPGFADAVAFRAHRASPRGAMMDVFDGAMWRREEFAEILGNSPDAAHNLAFGLFVDGFETHKWNTHSTTNICLVIYNLPPSERTKICNMIVWAAVPGPKKPSTFDHLLKLLIDDFTELYTTGWTLNVPVRVPDPSERDPNATKVVVRSKKIRGVLLGVHCDWVESIPQGGQRSFHSLVNGCGRCKITWLNTEGALSKNAISVGIDPTKAHKRYTYVPLDKVELRCDAEVKRLAAEYKRAAAKRDATKANLKMMEVKNGVKWTVLFELPYLLPVRQITLDPMHMLYNRVASWFWKKIRARSGNKSKCPWKLDEQHAIAMQDSVNAFILPTDSSWSRLPRKIYPVGEELKEAMFHHFLSAEWRSWVLVYSMPVLCAAEVSYAIVKVWSCFVRAALLLDAPVVTPRGQEQAAALLAEFHQGAEELFQHPPGIPYIHQLIHLAQNVTDYGPCRVFWGYAFERVNGFLKGINTNGRTGDMTRTMMAKLSRKVLQRAALHQVNGVMRGGVAAAEDKRAAALWHDLAEGELDVCQPSFAPNLRSEWVAGLRFRRLYSECSKSLLNVRPLLAVPMTELPVRFVSFKKPCAGVTAGSDQHRDLVALFAPAFSTAEEAQTEGVELPEECFRSAMVGKTRITCVRLADRAGGKPKPVRAENSFVWRKVRVLVEEKETSRYECGQVLGLYQVTVNFPATAQDAAAAVRVAVADTRWFPLPTDSSVAASMADPQWKFSARWRSLLTHPQQHEPTFLVCLAEADGSPVRSTRRMVALHSLGGPAAVLPVDVQRTCTARSAEVPHDRVDASRLQLQLFVPLPFNLYV